MFSFIGNIIGFLIDVGGLIFWGILIYLWGKERRSK